MGFTLFLVFLVVVMTVSILCSLLSLYLIGKLPYNSHIFLLTWLSASILIYDVFLCTLVSENKIVYLIATTILIAAGIIIGLTCALISFNVYYVVAYRKIFEILMHKASIYTATGSLTLFVSLLYLIAACTKQHNVARLALEQIYVWLRILLICTSFVLLISVAYFLQMWRSLDSLGPITPAEKATRAISFRLMWYPWFEVFVRVASFAYECRCLKVKCDMFIFHGLVSMFLFQGIMVGLLPHGKDSVMQDMQLLKE
jgi:hypothetical protein